MRRLLYYITAANKHSENFLLSSLLYDNKPLNTDTSFFSDTAVLISLLRILRSLLITDLNCSHLSYSQKKSAG